MLCNRLPTKTANGYMTPYEFINGHPPNMEYFRIWGCKCYVRDPRGDMRKDWSDKSRVGVLMGYSEHVGGSAHLKGRGLTLSHLKPHTAPATSTTPTWNLPLRPPPQSVTSPPRHSSLSFPFGTARTRRTSSF